MTTKLERVLVAFVVAAAFAGSVRAQPWPMPPPPPNAPPPAPAPKAPAPAPAPPPKAAEPAPATTGLRVHILSNRNTYVEMPFDVFSVDDKQLATSSAGVLETEGQLGPILPLKPGVYKIVRKGEPFEARVDYAIATVAADRITEYVIVVDPDSLEFRGSGPLIGELPLGLEIAGIRLSLNGGGSLLIDQVANGVGTTSGTTSQFGLFGNFGLVFDRDVHFLDVSSDFRLDLIKPITGSAYSTRDRFQASGLYSYKINNPIFGPYVRAAMKTRIFPGYIYFQRPGGTIVLNIRRLNGAPQTVTLGTQANPDDLRYKVASAFSPLLLQEELGANLKAVDVNLLVLKAHVATRIGFAFRQGFTNGLLVADGQESSDPVPLREVDNYNTLGPVIGANASVTLARWLFGAAQFGVIAPLLNTSSAASGSFAGRLLIDFSGSAGFKVPILTNLLFASADYTFRLERDAFITAQTQFEQALMVRGTITLF